MTRKMAGALPFFIIGNPRSGTTLLRLMLNQHDAIVVPPECGFSVWLSDEFVETDFSSSNNINKFVSRVVKTRKFETWNLVEQEIRSFLNGKNFNEYWEIVLEIYMFYAIKHNKTPQLLGDKNNFYIKHLDKIDSLFDAPKFVFIVRDGRDVACSYLALQDIDSTSEYAPKLSDKIVDIANEWNENNQKIISHLTTFPARGLLIRYEDLINNPEDELQRCCTFLGLDYQPKMLAYYEDNDEPSEFLAWKKKILQPPDNKNSGMYKKILGQEEIETFNHLAGTTLSDLGYV